MVAAEHRNHFLHKLVISLRLDYVIYPCAIMKSYSSLLLALLSFAAVPSVTPVGRDQPADEQSNLRNANEVDETAKSEINDSTTRNLGGWADEAADAATEGWRWRSGGRYYHYRHSSDGSSSAKGGKGSSGKKGRLGDDDDDGKGLAKGGYYEGKGHKEESDDSDDNYAKGKGGKKGSSSSSSSAKEYYYGKGRGEDSDDDDDDDGKGKDGGHGKKGSSSSSSKGYSGKGHKESSDDDDDDKTKPSHPKPHKPTPHPIPHPTPHPTPETNHGDADINPGGQCTNEMDFQCTFKSIRQCAMHINYNNCICDQTMEGTTAVSKESRSDESPFRRQRHSDMGRGWLSCEAEGHSYCLFHSI